MPDIHHPERPPMCATAPLLWGLIPLMMGIACASSGKLPVTIIVATTGLAVSLPWLWLRKYPALACFALGFCIQMATRESLHPDWEKLPPREASLEIELVQLFNARKPGNISGIGKILQSDIPYDTVTGRFISFYLEDLPGKTGTRIVGEALAARGIVTFLPFLADHDDFQNYLLGRDIFMTYNRGIVTADTEAPGLLQQVRSNHFIQFENILRGHQETGRAGNVLASMLLGNRRLLTDKQIDHYRNSGTYHLFAVSGLHVGCMAVFITGLLRICRLNERWIVLPALSVIWYYVWLTGSSPSSVRSGIMISCLMSGRLLWRQGHLFPSLVTSAWIVLIIQPQQMFSLGFQLSYSVVASILLIGLPAASGLARYLRNTFKNRAGGGAFSGRVSRIVITLGEISCISLSAGIVSMPLIIEHFQLFTPGGIVIGVLLNPIASATIMVGCLAMLLGPLEPGIATTVAMLSWPLIRVMEWLIVTGLCIPGACSARLWIFPGTGTLLVILAITTAWILQYLRQQKSLTHASTYLIPFLIVACGLEFASLDA